MDIPAGYGNSLTNVDVLSCPDSELYIKLQELLAQEQACIVLFQKPTVGNIRAREWYEDAKAKAGKALQSGNE